MTFRSTTGHCLLPAILFLTLFSQVSTAQTYVCAETNLGDFCMTLYHEQAPNTVANFLNYVEDGDFDTTIVHRSETNYVIQGGGYSYDASDSTLDFVPEDAPIENEFSLSNVRGTVAMAKIGSDPDSAASQWFINIENNAQLLDFANGGYTVFAGVSYGMDVVDAINALRLVDLRASLNGEFGSVPVLQNETGVALEIPEDFVQIRRMYASNLLPALTAFNGQSVTFPVRISGKLYEATLTLTAQNPELVFNVDRSLISVLEDSGQDAAEFSSETGLLTIPSVQAGANRFADVTLQMTDSSTLEFTLQDFERVETQ